MRAAKKFTEPAPRNFERYDPRKLITGENGWDSIASEIFPTSDFPKDRLTPISPHYKLN